MVIRATCLANEMHRLDALPDHINPCLRLLKVVACHCGDTAVIENTHQMAKDAMRDARHNQKSRVSRPGSVQHRVLVSCLTFVPRGVLSLSMRLPIPKP